MENPFGDQIRDQVRSLTEQLKGWYESHPRAQRAYEQLSADIDALVQRVESLVEETDALRTLRDRVAATIDPPGSQPGSSGEASAPLPDAEGKSPDTPTNA